LESEDVEEKVDMTRKVFVQFDFAPAESFFSGEIRALPSVVEIETLLQLNLWNLGLVWFYRDFSQVTFQ
jgi:hypothetical protein